MYITECERRFITENEVATLKEGDQWYIDSHDGEAFLVEVSSITTEAFYLEALTSGAVARLEGKEAVNRLYAPLPMNKLIH